MIDPSILLAIAAVEEPSGAAQRFDARLYSAGAELVSAYYPLGDAGEIHLLVRGCAVIAQSVSLGRASTVAMPETPRIAAQAHSRIVLNDGEVMVAALVIPDGETVMAIVHPATGNMEIVRSDFTRNSCE